MARTEARITCAIWDKDDWRALTMEAQWLYQAILEQKDLSLCGVLTWTPKRFAKLASNGSPAAVKKALDLLRERRYVVLDEDTDELWVRTLIGNDRVLVNHNSIVGMSNSFGAIHSAAIREAIVVGILDGVGLGGPGGGRPAGWWDGVVEGLPDTVRRRLATPLVHHLALVRGRASARPPVPPATSHQPPATPPSEDSSSSNHHNDGPVENEEEEDPRVGKALAILADRRLASRLKSRPDEPIVNRGLWLAEDIERTRNAHLAALVAMCVNGTTPAEMADAIEPPPPAGPTAVSPYEPLAPVVFEDDEEGRVRVVRT